MPYYDYECQACQEVVEVFQSMSEDPLNTCPQCTSTKFKRIISSASGIIFKGNGFYVTDSKKAVGSESKSSGSENKAS